MKFAAKRTWPDRPKTWEHHGEAETLQDFALAFAADRGLGIGTEFEVLDKDSDEATLVSFRVTATDPYAVGPVETNSPNQATDSHPSDEVGNQLPPPPLASAALGFFLFMAKTAGGILILVGGIMALLKYFNLTPPPG
jgi:hypothetical protein